MTSTFDTLAATRREFLASSASGLGGVALASLLSSDSPAAITPPHFAPTAKRCIFFFMAGGPSHVDLFDPKPILNNRDGQKMPDSILGATEFAFIKRDKAVLKGSPAKFSKRGDCGIEYSNMIKQIGNRADDIALIRTVHGEQFNHHPGQLLLSCGKAELGRPSIGAWLTYG
ncbi:MAG TPA: sulfatase, partial [Planctomycetaceae bacterium]|nr:sulfatase [Planctomycetaceae bacterium]